MKEKTIFEYLGIKQGKMIGISDENLETHDFVDNRCVVCGLKIYVIMPIANVSVVEQDISCVEWQIKQIIE